MLRTKSISLIAWVSFLACCVTTFAQRANRDDNQPSPDRRRAIPSVSQLFKQLDKNNDGEISQGDVAQTIYSRAFSRWDANQDGSVTRLEIEAFRRKRGIPIEGSGQTRNRPQPANASNNRRVAKLTIPDVDELVRIGPGDRVSRQVAQNSAFIIKTRPHAIQGERYVVLTDHSEPSFLKSLTRLAKHRAGLIIRVDDLATLYKDRAAMNGVRKQLQQAQVRFIAIAPRMQSYRENMLLGMWELLTTLDGDPQLDALPGILLASDAESFAKLIDRSISYVPQTAKSLRPFAISQVPSPQELRSLQKSGILRKLFAEHGVKTPTLGIYSSSASNAPALTGGQFWSYHSKSRRDFLTKFPSESAGHFEKASLLVMHGHGIPGMSCGVDIGAIPDRLAAKVVLTGSCFAAAPSISDFPAMRSAPGGYGVESRDAFALRAVDRGAAVVFGHMRLSQGFPHLFPVLETWMKGKTVGEAYQELINGIIEIKGTKSGEFVFANQTATGRQPPQNILLYVVIGDPALQPFAPLIR